METAQEHPDRLHIELDALVTRIVLDDNNRATGVEYLKGPRLYRAHGQPATGPGTPMQAKAAREVILCGGAFNTPQLLMLSGIGPRDVLERFGIPLRIELPGVGRNLQDRYEVGVVNRMNFERWKVLDGATFSRGDPQYHEWAAGRGGVYASNGAVLAAILKSAPERRLPDLFCFALLGLFGGYFPGYSSLEVTKPNYLTWAILKAHTQNRAGEVRLRSADPRDTPLVDFNYFEEGSDTAGEDLDFGRRRHPFCAWANQKVEGRRVDRRRGATWRRAAKRRRAERLCPHPRLGPSRVLHLRHRPARRGRRSRRRFPRARRPRVAGRRRLGLSAHPRLFYRQCGLHGRRKSRRRDPRRLSGHTDAAPSASGRSQVSRVEGFSGSAGMT